MKTINLTEESQPQLQPSVATIGFFDGVHRGHRFLIERLVETAHANGLESTIITFDRHPREVIETDYTPKLLSTCDEKMVMLSKTNIDNCVVLKFTPEMAALSAHDFMKRILCDRLNVKKLFIGYDNRFGHDRSEGFDDYVRYGKEMGIEVIRNTALEVSGINVSSSTIRRYLEKGEIEMAEFCLGHPYIILGHVVEGFQEGRKLGFPTANIALDDPRKLVPAPGVYAVKARVEGTVEMKRAMMNIGTRPTFNGHDISLETYILNFEDDIYGKQILVSFAHRLREERRFDTPALLVEQLKKDVQMVDEQFDKDIEE
jgi:riboflavin kinase/FMN adenylyltransferase